jgi:hypothetical protein
MECTGRIEDSLIQKGTTELLLGWLPSMELTPGGAAIERSVEADKDKADIASGTQVGRNRRMLTFGSRQPQRDWV